MRKKSKLSLISIYIGQTFFSYSTFLLYSDTKKNQKEKHSSNSCPSELLCSGRRKKAQLQLSMVVCVSVFFINRSHKLLDIIILTRIPFFLFNKKKNIGMSCKCTIHLPSHYFTDFSQTFSFSQSYTKTVQSPYTEMKHPSRLVRLLPRISNQTIFQNDFKTYKICRP